MLQQSAGESGLVLQTVQGAVAAHLRHLILTRQLLPGERLVQDELAARLGVSRTPIREALHKLAHEGFVTLSSYRGASVAEFSAAELEQIYAIRCALETHATYLAAQRITDERLAQLEALLARMASTFRQRDPESLRQAHHEFHASIYAAAEKRRLYDLISQYLSLADVYQRLALSLGRGARDPVTEHQDILATLRRRDAEATARLMRTHLELTTSELQALLRDGREQSDREPAVGPGGLGPEPR